LRGVNTRFIWFRKEACGRHLLKEVETGIFEEAVIKRCGEAAVFQQHCRYKFKLHVSVSGFY